MLISLNFKITNKRTVTIHRPVVTVDVQHSHLMLDVVMHFEKIFLLSWSVDALLNDASQTFTVDGRELNNLPTHRETKLIFLNELEYG